MQNYEHLGKPFQIGRLTIKNRFCMVSIGEGHRLLSMYSGIRGKFHRS